MMIRVSGVAGLMLAALVATEASAADPQYCNYYSTQAVNAAQRARMVPACSRNLHPGVFSLDYQVHYTWCLRVSQQKANAGTAQRSRHLRQCGGV